MKNDKARQACKPPAGWEKASGKVETGDKVWSPASLRYEPVTTEVGTPVKIWKGIIRKKS